MGVFIFVITISLSLDCFGFQLPVSPSDTTNLSGWDEFPEHPGPYKIVGGQEADIEAHPYQVSFIVNNTYFCGGFIVSENYILTAGHCAQDVDPSTVVLRAGSSYRKYGTIIPIAEVIPHPEYDNPRFDKDVAVMKSVDPIPINNETILALPLPPHGYPVKSKTTIMVSGWGKTSSLPTSVTRRLMAVKVGVISYKQCYQAYKGVMTENQFCAGNFFFGNKGACQGDSGGAAVQDGMAVGVVSYGRRCGQALAPSVFANIAAPPIRNFIMDLTGL